MEKTPNQRQEIEYNLNQILSTIFSGYKMLDTLIIKAELTKSTNKQKLLLKLYRTSKQYLNNTKQSVQKMQYYNNENMQEHLKKEMLKSRSGLSKAFQALQLLDKKILLSSNENRLKKS